ncbi:MAG: zinc-dependent metalloprotease, partial [Chitinophagaceae bacterium]
KEWTMEPSDDYSNLSHMYSEVTGQYQRYMVHVARNIGGYYETYKTVEQEGNIFDATPKSMQKDAVSFLHKNLFETPTWLIDNNILNKINSPSADQLSSIQDGMMGSLLSASRLGRMINAGNRFGNTYNIDEYFSDLKKGIWSEIPGRKKIDNYRRNLQKSYVERMLALLNPTSSSVVVTGFSISFGPDTKKTDIRSMVRAHLTSLRNEIVSAIPSYADNMSRYHLQDLSERIKQTLNPNN